jgi:hypothetical protein
MSDEKRMKQIRTRLRNTTQAPWRSMNDGNQYVDVNYGEKWTSELSSEKIVGASVVEGLPRAWNPWSVCPPTELENVSRFKEGDAEFVANAREDIAFLLALVDILLAGERQRVENDEN